MCPSKEHLPEEARNNGDSTVRGKSVDERGSVGKISLKEALKKKSPDALKRFYRRISALCRGDPGKLTLFTIVVLMASELPIYFFTLLDILKLKSLFKYRLHYDPSQAGHLGVRRYPPNSLIWKTAKEAELNFIGAYVVPGTLAITAGNKLGIHVYDTDAEKVSWSRIIKESIAITFLADLAFYALHRLMHTPRFYQPFHKKHHEFKYTIAWAHHWMEYKEALLFALPQALPPILLWGLTGSKMHVLSMWCAFCFTQLNAIVGHAGWQIPFIPRWLPFLQASYHDFHHVDYSGNFGAIFPLVDKIFGTFLPAFVASGVKDVPAPTKGSRIRWLSGAAAALMQKKK